MAFMDSCIRSGACKISIRITRCMAYNNISDYVLFNFNVLVYTEKMQHM